MPQGGVEARQGMPSDRWISQPRPLPLITQPDNRANDPTTDAKLLNAYGEFDPITKQWNVRQRYGLSQVAAYTATVGNGQAIYLWDQSSTNQTFYVVSGGDLWGTQLHMGNIVFVKIGTLAGVVNSTRKFVWVRIPSQPAQLFFTNGLNSFYIDGTGGLNNSSLVAGGPQGAAYLDGTLYVMAEDGTISGSGINDPTAPQALNTIIAQNEGDYGVYLTKQLTYIVAIKSTSTQFFYDAGNATGSPLGAVPGAEMPYGCLNAGTVAELDSNLFWVTSSRTHSPQVIMLSNLQPTIISTPAIERLLANFQDNLVVGNAPVFYALTFKYGGHQFYVVTSVGANITLAYDITTKLWSQFTDANGNYWPVVDICVDIYGNWVAQLATGGISYNFGGDWLYPTDSGVEFYPEIITPNFDGEIDRIKYLPAIRFQADKSPGTQLEVRCSDDDYKTWKQWRRVDLGRDRPMLYEEGSFYRRAYHFRKRGIGPMRLRQVDLQMDLGDL